MYGSSTVKTAYLKDGKVYDATVNVEVQKGIGIHLIGLPDEVVRENLLRVVTALMAAGYKLPGKKIVVRVEPVEEKKCYCAGFDLPIALGILLATGQVSFECSDTFYGELALDGGLRATGVERTIVEHMRAKKNEVVALSNTGCRVLDSSRALIGFDSLQQLIKYAEVCEL
ncbi:MAG: hypothetical protein IKX67_07235 [Bacteroidales bacterium]|nr:hypothetical protein [Bacteroidales bacterium]